MLKKKANNSSERITSCKATGRVQLSLKKLEVKNIPQMSTENAESFRKHGVYLG